MKNEYRQELIKGMEELKKDGFRCFITNDSNVAYGHIITPSDNVLYIQHEYFGGWKTSFEYIPSHGNGSSCQCEEKPFANITKDQILLSEGLGLAYANKLRAKKYLSSEKWLEHHKKFYGDDNLQEI